MVSPIESEQAVSLHDSAIWLENVSVQYRVPRERITSIKEYAIRKIRGQIKHDNFSALREVSFGIRPGEVFGIIGRNGAGKSTLLRVIARVIQPTTGRVVVRGKVAPLLELGAGFHPELSGRENVFLNGTLLGHSHAQMVKVMDEIIDFAELWDFIDAPLRTYSSGMYVRLGFAVATAIRPDILIIDEVLAVGDEQFKIKCQKKIDEYKAAGTTILLVAHDSNLITQFCQRAIWLDRGRIQLMGKSSEVIQQYRGMGQTPEPLNLDALSASQL